MVGWGEKLEGSESVRWQSPGSDTSKSRVSFRNTEGMYALRQPGSVECCSEHHRVRVPKARLSQGAGDLRQCRDGGFTVFRQHIVEVASIQPGVPGEGVHVPV